MLPANVCPGITKIPILIVKNVQIIVLLVNPLLTVYPVTKLNSGNLNLKIIHVIVNMDIIIQVTLLV
jgi:hypothetical protein